MKFTKEFNKWYLKTYKDYPNNETHKEISFVAWRGAANRAHGRVKRMKGYTHDEGFSWQHEDTDYLIEFLKELYE